MHDLNLFPLISLRGVLFRCRSEDLIFVRCDGADCESMRVCLALYDSILTGRSMRWCVFLGSETGARTSCDRLYCATLTRLLIGSRGGLGGALFTAW